MMLLYCNAVVVLMDFRTPSVTMSVFDVCCSVLLFMVANVSLVVSKCDAVQC